MRIKTGRSTFTICIAALLVTAASSCSLTKGKAIGERAVIQLHNQFNAEQYHDIYAHTDEGFRKVTSEQDMIALFEAVHRKLGTVKNSTPTGWHVNTTTAGTQVSLAYNTEFTEGNATEHFVFYVSGEDNARLFQYNINSPLLVTK